MGKETKEGKEGSERSGAKMMMETTIRNRDGKHIRTGFYDTEAKAWIVERNKKKHYMKMLRGWGLDNWTFEMLKDKYKLESVILTETSRGKVYKCSRETIDKNKIFKTFHPHRIQIFVPIVYWEMIDDGKDS